MSPGEQASHPHAGEQAAELDDPKIYRELFLLSPDAIFVEDFQGNVIDANEEALKLKGLRREELVGKHVLDLGQAGRGAPTADALIPWINGSTTQVVGHCERPDGSSVPVEIRCRRGIYEDVPVLLFHVRDMSEQVANESKLRKSRERYRQLLEELHEGVWSLDENGLTTYVNPALISMLGYTMSDMVLEPITTYLHNSDPLRVSKPSDLLKKLENGPVEILLKAANGRPVPVRMSCAFLNHSRGQADAYLLGISDLSEFRSLQHQLNHAQKMEALGQLVGVVTHDFNNVLMAVMGHAEFIRDQIPDDSPLREDVSDILNIGQHGKKLIDHLLLFSRRDGINTQEIRLADLLKNVQSLTARLLPQTVHLKLAYPGDDLWVRGNMQYLEQALINLVINARDALADGGAISLSACHHDMLDKTDAEHFVGNAPHAEDPTVCIQLEDDGSGIREDILSRIFDPYFTTKPKGQGTGLGLSTTYGIIQQHQGQIQVASRLGSGTCFRIHLPLMEKAPSPPPHPPLADSAVACTREVLVVEDDAAVSKVTEQMLKHLGCTPIMQDSAENALRYLEMHPDLRIGALVTDILLHGLDGVSLARQIRETMPDLPVIFITGYDEEQMRACNDVPTNA